MEICTECKEEKVKTIIWEYDCKRTVYSCRCTTERYLKELLAQGFIDKCKSCQKYILQDYTVELPKQYECEC